MCDLSDQRYEKIINILCKFLVKQKMRYYLFQQRPMSLIPFKLSWLYST